MDEPLGAIAGTSANDWYGKYLATPCRDRDIFTAREWGRAEWDAFHKCASMWARGAQLAVEAPTTASAVEAWQILLGDSFFPTTVA